MSFKDRLAFFQAQVAQNQAVAPIRSANENKVLRQAGGPPFKPIMPAPNRPNIKPKLAPLPAESDRSQLPPISGNQENSPPQALEAKPRMTFRDKVAMLSGIKGGGMAAHDYRPKRHTVEPMAPGLTLPPIEPHDHPDPTPEEMPPVKPVIRAAVKRPGVRRPTAFTPQLKPC